MTTDPPVPGEPRATGRDGTPPDEPVFAAPTPPGALPAEGLAELHLPATPTTPGPTTAPDGTSPGRRPGSGRARRGVLWAGAAVAVLAVVGGGVALGVTSARHRAWEPLPAAVTQPVEANAVQLVLGSCLRELPTGDVGRVTVVPCSDEHAAQVVGRTDSAPGAVWPGPDALGRRASAVCGAQQLGGTGREVEGVRFVVLTPSEAGWTSGDRASLCLAVTPAPASDDLLG
ncbi:septum formation family protein [Isoptericola sp. NPDC055881]